MSKEVEVAEYRFAGIGPDAKWAYEDTLDPSPSRFFLNHLECALLTEVINLRAEAEAMRRMIEGVSLDHECSWDNYRKRPEDCPECRLVNALARLNDRANEGHDGTRLCEEMNEGNRRKSKGE